jgi:hypothetical protein
VTDAAIDHADQRVIECLEHQPHVERDAAVTADSLPVDAAIQHFAGKTFALEDAVGHNADAAVGTRCGADNLQRTHIETHHEKRSRLHLLECIRETITKASCHDPDPFSPMRVRNSVHWREAL